MNRFVGSLIGLVLGLIIPLGLILSEAFSSRSAWWMRWLKKELEDRGNFYLFLAIFCGLTLFTIGYFYGRRFDYLEEEHDYIEDSNMELEKLATTDGLTGLPNNRELHQRLSVELENSYKRPLSCLLIDIDHFKKINDTYGHPCGDEVLRSLASIFKRSVRRVDLIGRLGGEEFLAVLSDTPPAEAMIVAKRIRKAVKEEPIELDDGTLLTVTVSIGLAASHKMGVKEKSVLLKEADQALYKAKNRGRDRVVRAR